MWLNNKVALPLYLLLTLSPLTLGVGYSLLYSFGLIGLMNDGFTLAHWQRLWHSPAAWGSIGYTLALTAVSLALALALALGVAWRYLRSGGAPWRYGVLFVPLMVSPLVAALAWYYVLSPGGFLSRMAWHWGWTSELEDFPRWVNDAWSVGIIVTHVFLVFPLFALLFIAQIGKERLSALQDMAQNLGASPGQFLRRVFVPVLLHKTRPIIWLYAVFLMGAYEVPLVLGRSSPQTMAQFITEKLTLYNLNDIPVGHAMAVVYSAVVFGMITFFIRKKALDVF